MTMYCCRLVLAAMVLVSLTVGCAPRESTPSAEEQTPEATEVAVTTEDELLTRGRYLVEGPMHCYACHSEIDWAEPGPGQPLPGKKGIGAKFPDVSVPGLVVASNITPDPETGIGEWTDEELGRAIREGVGRDGRRLFPVMPYLFYRSLSDEDLAAVITYIRSIEPVRNQPPATELPEPVLASLPPHQAITEPVPTPDRSDPIAYGAYLTQIGECIECHTPMTPQGQPMTELTLAGGRILEGPWGRVAAANLTPDPSGIPYYTRELFIEMMRTGFVSARELNHVMLWGYYRNMTDEDLEAIFAYLGTLEPLSHRVSNTESPTPCPLCGQNHGLGDQNSN
ncbi:MAG: cytochrome c [Thermoanaerobaculia bacterium]